MQKYHDEPKQYKGYLKSALVGTAEPGTSPITINTAARRRCCI